VEEPGAVYVCYYGVVEGVVGLGKGEGGGDGFGVPEGEGIGCTQDGCWIRHFREIGRIPWTVWWPYLVVSLRRDEERGWSTARGIFTRDLPTAVPSLCCCNFRHFVASVRNARNRPLSLRLVLYLQKSVAGFGEG
jgi:hypothetical protein